MSLGFQDVERPDDVFHGDGFAVVPPGLRPQREYDPGTVFGHLHGFGDQPVLGERLIRARCQQGLDRGARAGIALRYEAVEAVEVSLHTQAQQSALGRIGIDVVEMGEIGTVLGLAVHGDGVHRLLRAPRGAGECRIRGERQEQGRRQGQRGVENGFRCAHFS